MQVTGNTLFVPYKLCVNSPYCSTLCVLLQYHENAVQIQKLLFFFSVLPWVHVSETKASRFPTWPVQWNTHRRTVTSSVLVKKKNSFEMFGLTFLLSNNHSFFFIKNTFVYLFFQVSNPWLKVGGNSSIKRASDLHVLDISLVPQTWIKLMIY